MTEDRAAALAVLERAMEIEREGRDFYLRAVCLTQDGAGQDAFRNLADDEEKHLNLLQRQYDSLQSDGQWIDLPETQPAGMDLEKPLFPRGGPAAAGAVTPATTESDALLFGLEIESRSYDFYRKAAVDTQEPPGRRIFEFLAEEEALHFDILMIRYDLRFGPVEWSA